MPICKGCGEEADELLSVRVGNKTKRLCEECSEALNAEQEVLEAGEAAVQRMMEFKGRR